MKKQKRSYPKRNPKSSIFLGGGDFIFCKVVLAKYITN
jgi:hypothetical protein